jgi:hypothetical protein
MKKNKNMILKTILVFYILLITLIPKNYTNEYIELSNTKIIQTILLILIAIFLFYDVTIAILLTIIMLLNGILLNKKDIPIKNNIIEETKDIIKIPKANFMKDDEEIYKNNIHNGLYEYLPDTSKMVQMQTNIYDEKNIKKSLFELEIEDENIKGVNKDEKQYADA